MFSYRIIVKVLPEKQHEFHQAVSDVFDRSTDQGFSGYVINDMKNPGLYIILFDMKHQKDIHYLTRSDDFKYLNGALRVLGEIKEAGIFKKEESEIF